MTLNKHKTLPRDPIQTRTSRSGAKIANHTYNRTSRSHHIIMTRYKLVADNVEKVAARVVSGDISDRTLYLICVAMLKTPAEVNKHFMNTIFTSDKGRLQSWRRKMARRLARFPFTPDTYGAILRACPGNFVRLVVRHLDPHHLTSPDEALQLVGLSDHDLRSLGIVKEGFKTRGVS